VSGLLLAVELVSAEATNGRTLFKERAGADRLLLLGRQHLHLARSLGRLGDLGFARGASIPAMHFAIRQVASAPSCRILLTQRDH